MCFFYLVQQVKNRRGSKETETDPNIRGNIHARRPESGWWDSDTGFTIAFGSREFSFYLSLISFRKNAMTKPSFLTKEYRFEK